jgi:putative nucleotidyltransferase with HDIG domain
MQVKNNISVIKQMPLLFVKTLTHQAADFRSHLSAFLFPVRKKPQLTGYQPKLLGISPSIIGMVPALIVFVDGCCLPRRQNGIEGRFMNEVPVPKEQRLQEIHDYISRMPSLSTTVTKTMEICGNPNSSPNDLNRVISLDPVLTGQLLRLVRSAYYSLPHKVASLTRAIIMLGLNTVKNLVLSIAILESLGGKKAFRAFSANDFWTHSICVGVAAKSMASAKGIPTAEREEYFVAGLLHDLGKIPLNSCFADEYGQALESARSDQKPLCCAEDMVFGMDHNIVGRMIAEKWQLGETIIDSLFHHHNPDKAREQNRQFVTIVALADTFANSSNIGFAGNHSHSPEDPALAYFAEQVGVSKVTLSGLGEIVSEEIEKARIFLQLTKKG